MASDQGPDEAGGKPPIPEDWSGEPLFVIFFIPSPSPVALPHGATVAIEREETIDWLKGAMMAPTEGVAPVPGSDKGQNHVVVRVWRLPEKLSVDMEPIHRALSVARDVMSDVSLGPEPKDIPLDDFESGSTVFEAITPLIPSGDDAKAALSDAFDRCLEAVGELTLVYMVASKDIRTTIPSEMRLFPLIPFTSRTPDGSEWGGLGMFMVNPGAAHLPTPTGSMGHNDMKALITLMSRMKRGDPMATFAIWARHASRAFWLEGDYAAAIIYSSVASEVVLDTVLLMMAWEKATAPAVAAEWFDHHLAKRVRTYYHARLGGNWDTGQPKRPVGQWSESVRIMRNRVVHRGYWPTRQQANAALEGLGALEDFVKDRLGASRSVYPRVALMVLGLPGLTKRGMYKGKIKKFVDEVAGTESDWLESFAIWVEQFDQERSKR